MELSRSQIDRLGDRLRHENTISDADLEMLQEIRHDYGAPLLLVQRELHSIGLEPTGRLKTIGTIIDKLRRESTRLSTIQDIAGARVVEDVILSEQDNLVHRIQSLPFKARIQDRRKAPSHGYRAVHVILSVEGKPVEVQVRTRLQDQWAQIFEALADRWGRGIRYGEVPEELEQPSELDPSHTRAEFIELLKQASVAIAQLEEILDTKLTVPKVPGLHPLALRLRFRAWRLNRQARRIQERGLRAEAYMRELLGRLISRIEETRE